MLRVAVLLLAILVSLGIVIEALRQLAGTIGEPRQPAPVAVKGDRGGGRAAKSVALTRPSQDQFAQTLTRPIFYEGRQYPSRQTVTKAPEVAIAPPPPPASPPAEPQFNASELQVSGIAGAGSHRRALIEGPAVPAEWYPVGSVLRGWTVSRIEDDRVTFTNSGATASIDLWSPTRATPGGLPPSPMQPPAMQPPPMPQGLVGMPPLPGGGIPPVPPR